MVFFIIMNYRTSLAYAHNVFENTVIAESIDDGIKVLKSCVLRFENMEDIFIGNSENNCSGIEIEPGVTLIIDVASKGNVNIYGGYYFKDGNEYDCAGIYVPNKSTLIIDSRGEGNLIVYPFDRGAGIGGNGILVENFQKRIDCQNAGNIIIKKGKVLIKNSVEYGEYAKGAGIGGGGVCNVNNEIKFLYGGNLKMFYMLNGEVTIMMNSEEISNGIGAGIGGGGVANLNNSINNIQGGNASNIVIEGGKINIYNKSKGVHKGLGAMIGGGGIYNTAEVHIVSKGRLETLRDSKKINIYCDDEDSIFGDGGIYSNGITIESSFQKENLSTPIKNFKGWVIDKALTLGVFFSALFMIFELVT